MRDFDHEVIDTKWQDFWENERTFSCQFDTRKPKYYVLDMFPYPSGAGLHVGHTVGYTATDFVARYRRMMGYNVLHPMGWDSFGLPAERYAIRTGVHPAITTKQNIDTYRRQLKSLGFSYDWSREVATSDPSYYKWTQWIFTKLYEQGLAYEAEMPVNFCPALGTVLANEEVVDGKSSEGGHPVVRMPLRQWILKITAYADRLLQDLELVDWPESIKALQRNWIGRSEGLSIEFPIEGKKDSLSVFTTRQDTIFGVSFMAIAPEHPLLFSVTTKEQKEKVDSYFIKAREKTEFERTEISTEKTGVFTGGYCVNPMTGKKVPIWVADYILPSYGTGAIMGVPAHDVRDHEFAKKYHLPIVEVIRTDEKETDVENEAFEAEGLLVNSATDEVSFNDMPSHEAKEKISAWFEAHGVGKKAVHYKLRDWLFSRQRYWGEPIPILHFADGSRRSLGIDELPLMPPKLEDYSPTGDGNSPLKKVPEWVNIIDAKTGLPAARETNTMPQWAGSCWYYLRFCDPLNDHEAWNKAVEAYWMPVDLYVGGAEHAVLHLLYARFWHKVLYDCGYVTHPEPFYALRNQGLVVSRSYKDKTGHYVAAEDVIEDNGVYLHKKSGEVLTSQVEKMSKSKLNGVPPDDTIREFGADAFRLAVAFMGPLEKEKVWSNDALQGCRRFLTRVYDMVTSEKVSDLENPMVTKLTHRLVAKLHSDVAVLQFNTLVAKMMEFVNEVYSQEVYPRKAIEGFVLVLSIFAPHISEELWRLLGHSESIAYAPFPEVDPQYLEDDVVTFVIQVNGKVRGRLELPKDRPEEEIIQLALEHPNVSRFVAVNQVVKTVVVPNKLLNFVVRA
jgi:leucyl-tRNA synthetase